MFEGKKRIGRHILEIRLKNRLFSFMDLKGRLADFVIQKTGFERVSFQNANRIDIASDNFTEVYFFTWESFGLQIDAAEDFDIFKTNLRTLINIIKTFPDYRVNSIVRIGTRSMFMNPIKGFGFEELKSAYKNIILKDQSVFEQKTNSKVNDVAYFVEAVSNNGGKINITTGPVTKEEVLVKYFNNVEKYKNFDKKNGIFYDIDLYQLGEKEIANIDDLVPQIESNINEVEKNMDGFIEYFKTQING